MSVSRRGLLQLGALGAAATALPARAQAGWTNVLIVVLGGTGHPPERLGVALPHREALAAQSTVYTAAHTADPAAGPALASLLTGRPSAEHGVVLDGLPLAPDAPTLLSRARAAGRRVAWAGGMPLAGRRAADEAEVLVGPGDDARTVSALRAFLADQTTTRPWLVGLRLDPLAALQRHRQRHGGAGVLELGLAPDELPLPPKVDAPPPGAPAGFVAAREPRPRDVPSRRQDAWMLARALEAGDALLGAVVDALAHSAHDRSTLLVVVGEHGDAAGVWGLEGGSAPLPGVLRVPLLFRWGTERRPQRCTVPVSCTALAPTLARVMGLEPLPGADAFDLRTPVARPEAPVPPAVHCDLMVDGDVVITEDGALFSWREGEGLDQLLRPADGGWQDPAGHPLALSLRQLRAARMAALRPAALHRGGLARARATRQRLRE